MGFAGRIVLFVLGTLGLSSCGLFDGGEESSARTDTSAACQGDSPETVAKREDAYQSTLRPLLMSQTRCKECHERGGSSPILYLAEDGYATARNLADLAVPANSRFTQKIERGNHYCGDLEECRTLAKAITAKIGEWAQKESGIGTARCEAEQNRSFELAGKMVRASELVLNSSRTFRWDVGSLDPHIGKVWFEVQIRLFTTGNPASYYIERPVLATAEKKFLISNLRIWIAGSPATSAVNFAGIESVVGAGPFDPAASAWNFTPLTSTPQLMLLPAEGHTLGFSFDLEPSDAPETQLNSELDCKARDLFGPVMTQILAAPTPHCVGCHADVNPTATAALAMTGDVCVNLLRRSRPTSPLTSDWYVVPTTGARGHDVLPINAAQQALIRAWLEKEAELGN